MILVDTLVTHTKCLNKVPSFCFLILIPLFVRYLCDCACFLSVAVSVCVFACASLCVYVPVVISHGGETIDHLF